VSVEQEIKVLEDRRYKAMVAADVAELNELLADDMIYTHSNAIVDNKKTYIEGIIGKRWAYSATERPEETIQVFGDTAKVHGHVRLTLKNPDGSSRTVNARFLNLWVKRQNKWQMVGWQSAPIPAA
jgi:ketosteroid isomerase-like protein